jgi:hypothetical protein
MKKPSEYLRDSKPWTLPVVVLVTLMAVVILGVVFSLVFAGCASQRGPYTEGENGTVNQSTSKAGFTEHTITLNNGWKVTCITWSTYDYTTQSSSSGMDCLEPQPTQ